MRMLYGKSAKTGKNIYYIDDELFKDGKQANSIIVGKPGVGKTRNIRNKIKQIKCNSDTKVIVVAEHCDEWDKQFIDSKDTDLIIEYDTLENEFLHYRNIIESFIDNYKENNRIYIFFDIDSLDKNSYTYKFLEELYRKARVNNCVITSTYRVYALIPYGIIHNTSILEIYTLREFKCYIDAYEKIVDIIDYNKASYIKKGYKVLIIDGHKIELEDI